MIDRITTSNINTKRKAENKQTTFKGVDTAVLGGLRGLSNSPALGACAVDLCSMVIPRTAIEFKNRGKQAGIEAGFREGSSCFIHACVGLIGFAAASLISGNFNKKYGVKAQNIFANSDTIKNMESLWKNSQGDSKQFYNGFIQSIKGLNGSEWKTVSEGAKNEITEGLVKLADKSEQLAGATGKNKKVLAEEVKQLKSLVVSQITKDTGANASFKLKAADGAKEVSSGLSELVDNAVGLSNTFKNKPMEKLPSFVKSLIKNKNASTILGLGICAAFCMSVQPVNRYLTKKRTGQDSFVGVDSKEGDKTKGFKAAKRFLGIAFPVFAISTIGSPKNLLSNVQFNSKVPSINQFKLLYGSTIGSRFLSSRDSNELREGVIKDSLGFTNWLILGGMVSKLTARALGGKELINNPVANEGGKKGLKYAAKWLTQSSVKSYDEVLLPAAKEITKDGKLMKFSQLFKNADNASKSKVLKIAGSQVAGYLYSGLVLGIGISKLNIFITKQIHNKNKAGKQMKDKISESPYKNINTEYALKMNENIGSVFKDFN